MEKRTNENDAEQKIASAIKKMVIGCIIAEYGMLQLVDNSKMDLKQRVKAVITASRRVQDWFLFHPNGGSHYKEIFQREFLRNEIILIAELLEVVWGIDDDSIEEIIRAIKANTNDTNVNASLKKEDSVEELFMVPG